MTQFNPKLRYDSDPDKVWDSKEVNAEINGIETAINTLDSTLLDTTSDQVINGQKTFFNLYLDSDGIETYDSYMNHSVSDISPVFGAGNIALENNGIPEEGGYSKPNVSGFTSTFEVLNPSFIHGDIILDVVGTSAPDWGYVKYHTGNIPLFRYDYTLDGTNPKLGTSNIEITYPFTSVATIGTTQTTGTGITSNGNKSSYVGAASSSIMYLVLAYNPTTNISDMLLVAAGFENSIPKSYLAYRIIGFLWMGSAIRVMPFVQYNGAYHTYGGNNSLAGYYFDSPIYRFTISGIATVHTQVAIATVLRKIFFSGFSNRLFENIPEYRVTSTNARSDFGLDNIKFKIPLTYDNNGYIENSVDTDGIEWYVDRFNHGDIIL
jgi:hypothetical protein